jgi:hypothetical protein
LAPPSWWTGRRWRRRGGAEKLTRPQEPADEWGWRVEHTVPLGPEPCWGMCGMRRRAVPARGRGLRQAAGEPLAGCLVTPSHGAVVSQPLEASGKTTGIPSAIMRDQGSDLQAGGVTCGHAHAATSSSYALTHPTAAVGKRAVPEDTRWHAFPPAATPTNTRVQHTAWAWRAPPTQRTNARSMPSARGSTWGRTTRTVLDTHERAGAHARPQDPLEAPWGGRRGVREQLQGLERGAPRALKALRAPPVRRQRPKKVGAPLGAVVAGACLQGKPSERLLGSRDVREAVCGTGKRLDQDQAKSGGTGLRLRVAALGSTPTTAVRPNALATVSTKPGRAWCKKPLGPSVQAQRKKALAPRRPTEQKRDPFQVAV